MNERTQRLYLRVSQEEKAKMEKAAAKNGQTVSAYLRYLVYADERKKKVVIDVAPLKQMIHELLKQGTNLNQMMYFLNSHSNECSKSDIESVRKTIERETATLKMAEDALWELKQAEKKHRITLTDSNSQKIEEVVQNED